MIDALGWLTALGLVIAIAAFTREALQELVRP